MFNDKFGLTEAVLNGKKTMTRRICKYERPDYTYDAVFPVFRPEDYDEDGNIISPLNKAFGWATRDGKFTGWNKAQYRIGEVVAIAQSYHSFYNDECDPRMFPSGAGWLNKMLVKPELMPHQIQITDIRIQKLRDISDEDVIKEGFSLEPINDNNGSYAFHHEYVLPYLEKRGLSKEIRDMSAKEAYSLLIDKIYPNLLWGNPYVFIYEFKLIK